MAERFTISSMWWKNWFELDLRVEVREAPLAVPHRVDGDRQQPRVRQRLALLAVHVLAGLQPVVDEHRSAEAPARPVEVQERRRGALGRRDVDLQFHALSCR
ncbi:MAG: hypothetical protein QM765_42190 [Myxococcales bacterium]